MSGHRNIENHLIKLQIEQQSVRTQLDLTEHNLNGRQLALSAKREMTSLANETRNKLNDKRNALQNAVNGLQTTVNRINSMCAERSETLKNYKQQLQGINDQQMSAVSTYAQQFDQITNSVLQLIRTNYHFK